MSCPIERLEALAAATTMQRAAQRAANHARFPWFAEIALDIGPEAKLLWAMDADGEIGKQPKDEPGTFWISGESYVLLMADLAGRGKGKAR